MKRLPLPDLLKGFAVFLIVPVHILELFIDYPGRESLFGKILLFWGGPIAVPVFMIVMGYLAAKKNWLIFIRGIKIFALGCLLNIGLNFHLLLRINFENWPYNPLEYILGVDIFYLAGLSLIFIALIHILKKGKSWFSFGLMILILGLTSIMNKNLMVTDRNYVLPFIAGTYSWSYFPLFPWLAYSLAGFTFYFWEEKIMLFFNRQKLVSGIIIGITSGLVIWYRKWGFVITIDLPNYYHHTFWYSVWALGIIVLWVLFLRFVNQKIPDNQIIVFLKWLGKNITVFYVVQWLIIGNIATAIYQSQNINRYIFWFSGIFVLTVFITWLLEKTNIRLARKKNYW